MTIGEIGVSYNIKKYWVIILEEIAVVANDIGYSKILREDLNTYFKDYVKLNTYSLNDVDNMEYLHEKYIVLSSFTIFQKVKAKILKEAKMMIINLALNKYNLEKLNQIPRNSKALLVNIDYRSCMQVITMLFSLGFQELDLVPYYNYGEEYDDDIRIAITPGEAQLVPKGIATVIDLGQRMISFGSIIELASLLGIEKVLETERTLEAKKSIADTNTSIEKIIGENTNLIDNINFLIRLMEQGIVITDITGKITMCNDRANKLLISESNTIIGLNILEIFPNIDISSKKKISNKRYENVFSISGVNMVVSCKPIITNTNVSGNIITVDKFEDIEKRQHSIRTKITGCGHNAIFNFDDILGKSESILKAKVIAERIADSNSSVLIIGESGTGKELFAQAIHNASGRAKYNFVAINCATLPGNLLESELFGYEEGAFSGAKKGGKIGLIELAHNGTLFLDEVGEMPIDIQAKLLRVLEEQRFMKLGGKDVLSTDIRVVAATNKSLVSMVKNGKFRDDLYYRLNVLPINLPSLRERKDDILPLVEYYKDYYKSNFSLSPVAKNIIVNYDWPGNIRELKNTVEYLINLQKSVVEADDIPFVNGNCSNKEAVLPENELKSINKFILKEGKGLELFSFILSTMEEYYYRTVYIGRDKLFEIARDRGRFYSLSELKYGLSELNDHGFVKSYKGRKGSVITETGIELRRRIDGFLK